MTDKIAIVRISGIYAYFRFMSFTDEKINELTRVKASKSGKPYVARISPPSENKSVMAQTQTPVCIKSSLL
jgi:hypothetical protein